MKNEELYYRTVNILAKAFRDEALCHGRACACAVGNLVLHYKGGFGFYDNWYLYLKSQVNSTKLAELGRQEIRLTGYSADEIRAIESAFESVIGDCSEDKDGFLGLMAVVDALDIIHENTSSAITDKAKKQIEDKVVMEFV